MRSCVTPHPYAHSSYAHIYALTRQRVMTQKETQHIEQGCAGLDSYLGLIVAKFNNPITSLSLRRLDFTMIVACTLHFLFPFTNCNFTGLGKDF